MGSWWKTPWQFFLCVCVWVERGRGGGGMNTGWWGRRWGMRGGWGSLLRFPPSAPPFPPADPLRLTGCFLLSSQERAGGGWLRGFLERGCPFGVKPGASASVRKGIWRAWWKPPCYLAQAQRGASHASLPTWETRRERRHRCQRAFFHCMKKLNLYPNDQNNWQYNEIRNYHWWMDHTIYQKQHHTAFLCIQHSGHRSGYKATNIPQSQEDTYMRPQSECLAMFFNVKAAVSRMCLVTGPSFSSWERKQTRIIFSRSGSWKRALVLDIWGYRDDNYNDNQCEHPHCWMISFCKIVVQSTCCLSSCDT